MSYLSPFPSYRDVLVHIIVYDRDTSNFLVRGEPLICGLRKLASKD